MKKSKPIKELRPQLILNLKRAEIDSLKANLEQAKLQQAALEAELQNSENNLKKEISKRQEADNRLREILETSLDPMIIVDKDGKILLVNSLAEDFFGYAREEMLSKPLEFLLPDQHRSKHLKHGEVYVATNVKFSSKSDSKVVGQHKSGKMMPVNYKVRPVGEKKDETIHGNAIYFSDDEGDKSVERLSSIFSYLPVVRYTARITSDELSITHINKSIYRLSGFTADSIIQNPTFWNRRIHPEDQARVLRNQQNIVIDQYLEHEYRWKIKSGNYRWVLDRSYFIQLGQEEIVVGVLEDVTRRVDAEHQAREKEKLLDSIFEHTSAAIYIKNNDGQFVLHNRKFIDTCTPKNQDIIGKTIYQILPKRYADKIAANDAQVVAKKIPLEFEEKVRTNKGLKTFLAIKFPLFADNGKISGIGGISTDITERKVSMSDLENQIKLRTNELRNAYHGLAHSLRLKDQFLQNITHELRTPLNVILGNLEILQEEIYGTFNIQQKKSLGVIHEYSNTLLSMIDHVLSISKWESGNMPFHPQPLVLRNVCEKCIHSVKQRASLRHIEIEIHYENPGVKIVADEQLLAQLLINILDNAIKFSEENGKVEISSVTSSSNKEFVDITVMDKGIGIDKQHLSKIFQPFYQVESGYTRQYTGTGLGLSLADRLAKLHGGSMSVKSEKGKGSCFIVTLPIHQSQNSIISKVSP